MKGLALIFLAQVAFGRSSVLREAVPECEAGSPTHLPHPTDCTKYYTCDQGVAILQECPAGLWWNAKLESCDFPEHSECGAEGTTSGTGPTVVPPPSCESGSPTHVPHPTDCSKYYTCDDGVAILQECPAGLWWNVAIEGCDFPENTECGAQGTTPGSGTTAIPPPSCSPGSPTHIPHPTDCSKYYTCTNGEAILQQCAPGLWWSDAIEGCDLPEHTECTPNGSTPEPTPAPTTPPPTTIPPPTCGPGSPTHIPHPTDCSKYYTCTNGEAILQQCAPGLWWSDAIEGCDLPEHTDCGASTL